MKGFKIKDKIFIKDWLVFKPYSKHAPTDMYYLGLCNKVLASLTTMPSFDYLDLGLNHTKELACFLTSYFEDLVSGSNIWNTFVRLHKEKYDKILPIYEVGEGYYEQEINLEDVRFLIWYFVAAYFDDDTIEPKSTEVLAIAQKVMEVFEEEWETAPENELLKSCYEIEGKLSGKDEYYEVRRFLQVLLFETYLFFPDTCLRINEEHEEILEEHKGKGLSIHEMANFLDEATDTSTHTYCTRLLGLTAKEWAAEILGKEKQISKDILQLSDKIFSHFLYKGQDDKVIHLEHIASEEKFEMVKKSFDSANKLVETDTMLLTGMIRWKGEWWFTGLFGSSPYNAEIYAETKNDVDELSVVDFLNEEDTKKELLDNLKIEKEIFLEMTDNALVTFMPIKEVHAFMEEFLLKLAKKKVKLSEKEREENRKRMETLQIIKNLDSENNEDTVIFFNPKVGIELAFDISSAFPLPNNPFYKEGEFLDDIIITITSDEFSAELAKYCVENFKGHDSFFQTEEGKHYVDDLDFLLRFWKQEDYYND